MVDKSNEVDETSRLLPGDSASSDTNTPSQIPKHPNSGTPTATSTSEDTPESLDVDETIVWTVVPIILLGVLVAHADVSLVIASSQSVASEFGALNSASWLVTSYSLGQCAAQPIYGKISVIFGRRNILAISYVFFATGCLIVAIGREYWEVLIGRGISGVGGAGMIALVSIIIADLVPARKIAAWRSFVNVAATTGRSLGGPVGGWLCDTVGWRWSFLGQVPLTVVGLVLILWRLPGCNHQNSQARPESKTSDKFGRIDLLGAITLATTISCLLLTLDFAAKPVPWYIPSSLAAGTIVLACVFYAIERYHATEPILPLEFLTKRPAWTAYCLTLFQIAAQTGIFYSTPIYFQIATGSSVAEAGSRMVPAVIGNATGGIVSGIIISKTGRYKYLTVGASVLATTGFTLILLRWTGSTSWLETQYILLGGFGAGVIGSTGFVHLAAHFNHDGLAITGTTLYLASNLATAVGIQSSTMVLHATLWKLLNIRLEGRPDKQKILNQAVSSISSIRSLPSSTRQIVVGTYIDSLRSTYALSIGFAVIGVILGISIREGLLK